MFQKHVVRQLSAYCHLELTAAESKRVQQHLEVCQRCRRTHEEIRFGVELASQIKLHAAPESLWDEVAEALHRPPGRFPKRESTFRVFGWPRWAIAVTALFLLSALGAGWYYRRLTRPSWEVARLEGTPRVGRSVLGETGRWAVGDWLETDHASRALINVGDIGEVEIDPNTRVRLVGTRETEHRLRLARGTLHVTISAPPRYFIVDTPSAVATDLGCMYTLEVDDAGAGRLQVTAGWVAFELNGRESFVPAGAICETRPRVGPGTPYYEDAPAALIESLEKFDFENGGSRMLETVLSQARKEDAFTLWHLLSRVTEADRSSVYERLAVLVAAPAEVTRDGILRLDRGMLDLWWNALSEDDASWFRIWKGPFPQSPQ
ncbi:MAG: FecR domain-containing protein [Acidobacteria bacterium]|nr:FecR domain-containing protein [Acidobacteriota bacterium]MCI0627977.1 FecR domain-containing protein [Acidobacteriota bacterium]MCI0719879.1 FecR domain-containing protein [Acidobacteriota bacterium]